MLIKKWTGEYKKCDKFKWNNASPVKSNDRCRIKVYLQQRVVILVIIMINCTAYSQKSKPLLGFHKPEHPHQHNLASFSNRSLANVRPNQSSIDLISEASFNEVEALDSGEEDEDENYMQSPLDQTGDLEELGRFDESNFLDSSSPSGSKLPQAPTNTVLNKTEPTVPQKQKEAYGFEVDFRRKNNRYEQRAAQNQAPALRLVDGVECAYIIRRPGSDCITYSMIDWAVERARRRLDFQQPGDIMRSVELSESTINSIGEVIELSTAILANRFQLTWKEITFDLEQVDTSRTSLWDSCPTVYRSPPSCALLSRYRTHTGQCNNLLGGHLGSSNMPFIRDLPPDYGDWIGAPRRSSISGAELAPVRLIALELHPDIERPSQDFSAMYMAWGQLLNHDMAMASNARGKFLNHCH